MTQRILLVPGAWTGAWIWNDLKCKLKTLGHSVYTVTLSGLKNYKRQPNVNLEAHIIDVIKYIEENHLDNIILVGHSYSGAVIGQVADRIPEHIDRLIFIEAALPIDGKSMLASYGNDVALETSLIKKNNGRWPHPTANELTHEQYLTDSQKKYLLDKFVNHPGKTVTEQATIMNKEINTPSTFIGSKPSDVASESAFTSMEYKKIEGGHWPMLTKPDELAQLMV